MVSRIFFVFCTCLHPTIYYSIMYHSSPLPVFLSGPLSEFYQSLVFPSSWIKLFKKWISCPCKKWHTEFNVSWTLNVERVHWFTHTHTKTAAPSQKEPSVGRDMVWVKPWTTDSSMTVTQQHITSEVESSQSHPITMNKEMAKIVVHWKNVRW